jgi:hypothetical protein
MTLKEWKQFVENYNKHNEVIGSSLSINDYLLYYETVSFYDFIEDAYTWADTPKKQGYKYWEKIANRTKPVQ